MIRRLFYVPDYVTGSLNSLYIWSLSLQLTEYNSQHKFGMTSRAATLILFCFNAFVYFFSNLCAVNKFAPLRGKKNHRQMYGKLETRLDAF